MNKKDLWNYIDELNKNDNEADTTKSIKLLLIYKALYQDENIMEADRLVKLWDFSYLGLIKNRTNPNMEK